MRHHLLLVLVCLAGGCAESTAATESLPTPGTEPPSTDVTLYRSGWRLRAHVWKGSGSETLIDWSDQALDTNCSFVRFEDGSTRCAPTDAATQFGFSDSDCSYPAALVDETDPTPRYVLQTRTACAGEWPSATVLELRHERPAIAAFYQRTDDGVCSLIGTDGYRVFATSVASPSTFVNARVTIEAHGPFDLEVLTGEDGARQNGRVIDRARNAACTVHGMPDDAVGARCLPSNAGLRADGTFADAGCSELGIWGPFDGETCAAPTMALRFSTAPDVPSALFEVGALTEMHFIDGANCVGQPQTKSEPFYKVGPALAASAFPEMLAAPLGDGRLRAPVVTAPNDHRPLAAATTFGMFWDTKLAEYCDPQTFTDGVQRCVNAHAPDFTVEAFGYADAQCTQPVVQADGAVTTPRYATAIGVHGDVVLPEIAAVRPIVGKFDGPALYRITADGACAAVHGQSLKDAWLLGEQVAFDDAFERVAESLE